MTPISLRKQPVEWLSALWEFSRPHTIIGTTLSVGALYAIASALNAQGWRDPSLLLTTWLACLCGNIYIVGLNQLEDIEIDRINKPDLPLASGVFSPATAINILAVTGVSAVLLGWFVGFWLLMTIAISLTLGTAYSVPPLRLKRFPFWASFCIFTVRGIVVNLGLYLNFAQKSITNVNIPPEIWALTLFIIGFTFAIAIFKDIPDCDGDARYQISTFTLQLGAAAVLQLGRGAIILCYLGMIIAGFVWLKQLNPIFLTVAEAIAALVLIWRSNRVNLQDRSEIANFYQFVWKLFFLQYLIVPIACFLP